MSTSIDERVVEMRFDNRQFEQGAQTSLSTLDKLKNSLNLLGNAEALKSLGDVDTSGMSKLGSATDTVKEKFSILHEIAVGALREIGAKAANLGMQMLDQVNPLNQVNAGWDKYGEKTSAVQTIMAATRETWQKSAESLGFEGTQMEFVSDQLEKLNWFTDETSYGFTDLVSNIGKFTNNGVALEDAVTSMQGIATWAGLSGANVAQAGQAMYNFSQAMGAGSMKLQDWKSIENANMATTEFKQTVIDTALEMGKLKKNADGTYQAIQTIQKGGPTSFDIATFSTSLKDAWFDKDVMTTALEKFGKFTDELYKFQELSGMDTSSEVLGLLDKYAEAGEDSAKKLEILNQVSEETGMSVEDLAEDFEYLNSKELELGKRAFKASQEAKTFQEAIDSVKDAASTAWMNIFENIFGNYEEAKSLWTDFANNLWDVFVGPLDSLSTITSLWKELGGRDDLIDGVYNMAEAIGAVVDALFSGIGELDTDEAAKGLAGITKRFKEWSESIIPTEEQLEKIRKVSDIVFGTLRKGVGIIKDFGKNIFDSAKKITTYIKNSERMQKLSETISKAFDNIYKSIKPLSERFELFFGTIKKTPEFKQLSQKLDNVKNSILDFLGSNVVDRLIDVFDKLANRDLVSDFDPMTLVGKVRSGMRSVMEWFDKARTKIEEFGQKIGIDGIWKNITDAFKNLKKSEFSLQDFTDFFTTVGENIKEALRNIWETVTTGEYSPSNLYNSAKNALSEFAQGFLDGWKGVDLSFLWDVAKKGSIMFILIAVGLMVTHIANFAKKVAEIPKGFTDILEEVQETLGAYQNKLKAEALKEVAIAIAIMAGSIVVLGMVPTENLLKGTLVLSALLILTTKLIEVLSKYMDGKAQKGAIQLDKVGLTMAQAAKRIATLGGLAAMFIGFGIAVGILANVVDTLGKMNINQGLQGAIGLIGIATILVTAFKYITAMDLSGLGFGTAISILAFAEALKMLVAPIQILGGMSLWELIKGVGSLALAVLALGEASAIANPIMIASLGKGMFVLASAMVVMGGAGLIFNQVEWSSLGKMLLVFAVGLGTLMLAAAPAEALSVGLMALGGSILMMGGGLALGAAAVWLFADAITKMSDSLVPFAESLVSAAEIVSNGSDTIVKAFESILVGITEVLINNRGMLITGVLQTLSQIILAMLGWLETNTLPITEAIVKAIIGIIKGVAVAIGTNADEIGEAIELVLVALEVLIMEGISGILEGIFGAIPGAKAAIESLFDAGLGTAKQRLADAKGEMENGSTSIFGGLFKTNQADIDAADASGRSLTQSMVNGATEELQALPENFNSLPTHVQQAILDKYPDLQMAGSTIDDAVADGVTSNMGTVETAFGGIGDIGLGALESAFPGYTTDTADLMSLIATGVTDNSSVVSDAFAAGNEEWINQLSSFGDQYSTEGSNAATQYMTGFGSQETAVTTAMSTLIQNSNTNGIMSQSELFSTSGTSLMSFLGNGVILGSPTLQTAVGNVAGEGAIAAQNKQGEYETAAGYLTIGMANGVENNKETFLGKIGSLCSEGWSRFTSFFGIESPSKLMAWAGQMLDEGLGAGVEENANTPVSAMTTMAQSSFNAIKDAMAGADALLSDTVNPTITPVLDLTDVQNGASLMNGMLNSNYMANVGANIGSVNPYGNNAGQAANNSNINYGGFNIQIYSQPGMDEQSLATMVAQQIYTEILSREAVVY